VRVADGVVRIEQRTRVRRPEVGTDVSGPSCIYARVEVSRGSVSYLQGAERIPAPKRFAVFLPPFTVVQALLEGADVTSVGFAFRAPTSLALPRDPLLLPPEGPVVDISRCLRPAPLAARVKSVIDMEYATPLEIGRIAKRLRVSPATLSRVFRSAYGLPPVQYRHHVRIVDALTRLAEGEVPTRVFQDVGFDDLSRFYKLFKQVACSAPGAYRSARSKNAKT
jgi:AraC-like DNA-binding protein